MTTGNTYYSNNRTYSTFITYQVAVNLKLSLRGKWIYARMQRARASKKATWTSEDLHTVFYVRVSTFRATVCTTTVYLYTTTVPGNSCIQLCWLLFRVVSIYASTDRFKGQMEMSCCRACPQHPPTLFLQSKNSLESARSLYTT